MIEYKIKPVTRYIVSRYHQDGRAAGADVRGEFDNEEMAYQVGYALCKAEHDAAGTHLGDTDFIYPSRPSEANAIKDRSI